MQSDNVIYIQFKDTIKAKIFIMLIKILLRVSMNLEFIQLLFKVKTQAILPGNYNNF